MKNLIAFITTLATFSLMACSSEGPTDEEGRPLWHQALLDGQWVATDWEGVDEHGALILTYYTTDDPKVFEFTEHTEKEGPIPRLVPSAMVIVEVEKGRDFYSIRYEGYSTLSQYAEGADPDWSGRLVVQDDTLRYYGDDGLLLTYVRVR